MSTTYQVILVESISEDSNNANAWFNNDFIITDDDTISPAERAKRLLEELEKEGKNLEEALAGENFGENTTSENLGVFSDITSIPPIFEIPPANTFEIPAETEALLRDLETIISPENSQTTTPFTDIDELVYLRSLSLPDPEYLPPTPSTMSPSQSPSAVMSPKYSSADLNSVESPSMGTSSPCYSPIITHMSPEQSPKYSSAVLQSPYDQSNDSFESPCYSPISTVSPIMSPNNNNNILGIQTPSLINSIDIVMVQSPSYMTPEMSPQMTSQMSPMSSQMTPEMSSELSIQMSPQMSPMSSQMSSQMTPSDMTSQMSPMSSQMTPEMSSELSIQMSPQMSSQMTPSDMTSQMSPMSSQMSSTSSPSYWDSESVTSDPDWDLGTGGPTRSKKQQNRTTKPYTRKTKQPADRKERKKLQNKNAATRYRIKKKAEEDVLLEEESELADKNNELQGKVDDLANEIRIIKNLLRDQCKRLGIFK